MKTGLECSGTEADLVVAVFAELIEHFHENDARCPCELCGLIAGNLQDARRLGESEIIYAIIGTKDVVPSG